MAEHRQTIRALNRSTVSVVRSAVVLAALFACGDNRVGIPLEEFEAATLEARCDRFVRCGLFADDAACDGFFRKRPDIDLTAAIAAGVVHYSGPAASLCVQALAEQSCDTSTRNARLVPSVCNAVFVGLGSEGEPCVLDEECSSGTCTIPSCGELCCSGICRAAPLLSGVGGPCELDLDCSHDLFCGRDSRCATLGSDAAICDDDAECAYGFACIGPNQLMPGNCRAQPRIGEACLYMRCAELGATCTAGTCIAVGLPGTTCSSDDDCSEFALCDASSGTCVELPVLGEACNGSCAGEAWCDLSASNTCLAPQPNTAPCFSNDQCESLFCEEGIAFDACAAHFACF